MQYILLNGSPRGKKGNTVNFLNNIAEGIHQSGGITEMLHLNRTSQFDEYVVQMAHADAIVMGMPLYTDAMPAQVKAFMERLPDIHFGMQKPPILFFIQSGFPESIHSRYLEKYFEKMCRRLGFPYASTIIRGGGEMAHRLPKKFRERLYDRLREAGSQLAANGTVSDDLIRSIAVVEKFPVWRRLLYGFFKLIGAADRVWNTRMDKEALSNRFAAPYAGEERR